MAFMDDNFILSTGTAQQLYHGVAKDQPIVDYHCHLSPKDIADDRRFEDLTAIWLAGDHYKWRAMRANGVSEDLITGDKSTSREKFQAWAETVPSTLRNPALPLDPPRAAPPLRHPGRPRRRHGPEDLGRSQPPAEARRPHGPRHPQADEGPRRRHHR
jgi:hypothetical protein